MSRQAVAITIGGVDKTTLVETPADYDLGFNGAIGVANLTVTDSSGAYIPAADAVVEISVGGTVRWAGEIARREITEYGATDGVATVLTCHDYNELLLRGLINAIVPAGTLKAALQTLTNSGGTLHALGVTLDAAQVTGPSLSAFAAAWWTPKDFLDYLRQLTGYCYRISASKVLTMWEPGTVSSGVTISRANENYVSAAWADDRLDYRNRQWVQYGPSEVRDVDESWVGDGSTRTFPVKYQCASNPGVVAVNSVSKPVGIYGVDTMEWTWDAALTNPTYGTTGGFRQDVAYSVLTGSDTLTSNHPSQFPNVVFVQDSAEVTARGEWNRIDAHPDIVDVDNAIAWGTALIRSTVGRPTIPAVVTSDDTITPGETVVVDLGHIGLSSATAFVQGVRGQLEQSEEQVWATYALDLVGQVSGAYEGRPTDDELWERVITGAGLSGSVGGGGGGGSSTTIVAAGRSHVWANARSSFERSASWVEAPHYIKFRATVDEDVTVHVEVKTLNGATSVTPRIYDATSAAAAVTGTASTSTSWAEQTLVFSATAGHVYVLQMIGSNATHPIQCVGNS